VLHRGGVWLLVRMRDAGDASESHMEQRPAGSSTGRCFSLTAISTGWAKSARLASSM